AGKSPAQVMADFRECVARIHAKLPRTEIVFIGLCPTIARWKEAEANRELNRLVSQFAQQNPRVKYIETYQMSFDAVGRPRSDIFIKDMLHFNSEGYRLLTDLVRPYLR
ncbi:MAG: GDSL-type esterase/lipase family protein, partial [Acidobacteriota bacterium]